MPEYIPGVRNIGRRGRIGRSIIGLAFLLAALLLLTGVSTSGAHRGLRLAALPLFLAGFASIMEAQQSFCIIHGMRGTFDFFEPWTLTLGRSPTCKTVSSQEERAKDRLKAKRIGLMSLVASFLATTIALVL